MKKFKYIYIPVLCAVFLASCSKKEENTQDDKTAAFVMSETMYNDCTYETAKTENAQNQIRLFGKVTAENNNMAQVFPAMGGSVIKINAELGDYVKQGQLLASIQSTEVAGYQSQTKDADANVSIAERNLQSVQDMYEGKLASEKELVMAKKELEKAKAEQSRMGAVNRLYKLKSGSVYNMYAPISGYVVAKDISPNEMLTGSNDQAVFTIAKLDNVWVMANINETDLARVKEGQEVTIKTIAYPDSKIYGKIDKIFNVIDPQTRAAKAMIKVPNANGLLKPDMNATVKVHYTEPEQYITVPSAAVVFDRSRNFVMVFRDKNDIETREVTVYRALDDKTYITSGLKEGEKVIVKGNLLIYDAIND